MSGLWLRRRVRSGGSILWIVIKGMSKKMGSFGAVRSSATLNVRRNLFIRFH